MSTKTVKTKKSWKDKAASGKLPERPVPICLRGDLYAQIQTLDRELVRLISNNGADVDDDRMVGNPEAAALAAKIEGLRQEMLEDTEVFIIRALPNLRYTALQAEFPPRPGDMQDISAGYNRDEFIAALLRPSIVSPVLDDEDWAFLFGREADPDADPGSPEAKAVEGKITRRQYDELTNAAWVVNTGDVSVPFSPAASIVLKSDSESKRPNNSGSASNASTDGNPEPSPAITTEKVAA